MNDLEKLVRHMVEAKAVHLRKGTVLGKENWATVLKHLREEVGEFAVAVDPENEINPTTRLRNATLELGDILGIIVHARRRVGRDREATPPIQRQAMPVPGRRSRNQLRGVVVPVVQCDVCFAGSPAVLLSQRAA